MKRILFLIVITAQSVFTLAQGLNVESLMNNLPDLGDNICLSSVITDESSYSPEALKNIYSNMDRLISSHGILNLKENVRFFLATNYNIISKDIIPGIPTRVLETIQFNFIIGDVLSEKVFSSIAIQVKGAGINENKALLSAIQAIKWNNKEFNEFVINGKNKIIEYYTQESPHLFQEAEFLSKSGKFEEALGILISIPSACPHYKESMRRAIITYQEMIDSQANRLLRKAKTEWSASPDRKGAEKAITYIDSIPNDSKYENEVNILINDMNKAISEIDKKEWDFKKQQYNDSIRHLKAEEQAAKMREYAATHPYSSVKYSRSSKTKTGNGKGLFGGLIDKWNEQPTWKKILIGGGIGLAAAAAATAATVTSVAGALLARTSFHVLFLI